MALMGKAKVVDVFTGGMARRYLKIRKPIKADRFDKVFALVECEEVGLVIIKAIVWDGVCDFDAGMQSIAIDRRKLFKSQCGKPYAIFFHVPPEARTPGEHIIQFKYGFAEPRSNGEERVEYYGSDVFKITLK